MTTQLWKNVCVAALSAVAMGFVGASCSSTGNICEDRNVQCTAPLACDPGDGVCKCGGRGGVVCPEGSSCDPNGNTCVSTRCAAVDCSDKPGTSCDVLDGQCKCGGTGGAVCGATQTCNPLSRACVAAVNCNQQACPLNQACEAATGQCKCGNAVCTAAQTCTINGDGSASCVDSNCTGVSCTGSTVCDPADGLCKCNGTVCQGGQTCGCPAGSDGGCAADQRACRSSSLCASVTCARPTVCDPGDGRCKCGGPGAGGSICAPNQICSLGPPARCEGGEQCTLPDGGPKQCAGGTSCDPEDGQCKCGGGGGIVCAAERSNDAGVVTPAEICVLYQQQKACRVPCDTRNPTCPDGTYCYFDSAAATPSAYCAAPSGMQQEDQACTAATQCFTMVPRPRALHCLGLALGVNGLCRAYCDVNAGMAGCLQDVPRTCAQITTAPVGVGYCNRQ